MFIKGTIDGVRIKPMVKFADARGWLTELYREDELDPEFHPVMGYLSMTSPGVTRGPHEHVEQADYFCFIGPSNFKVFLWDNRRLSPTYLNRQEVLAGEDAPLSILIPPGVVHAYRNVGAAPGMVVNVPNRLYAGEGKRLPVDEIRHEADPDSPYVPD